VLTQKLYNFVDRMSKLGAGQAKSKVAKNKFRYAVRLPYITLLKAYISYASLLYASLLIPALSYNYVL